MGRGRAPTGFSERLAYARWVRQLTKADAGSDRDFADDAEVGYAWFKKWEKRDDAPQERTLVRRLSAYLGVPEAWLIDNEGEPPRPDLFAPWIAAHRWHQARASPQTRREAVVFTAEEAERNVVEPRRTPKKRVVGGPRKSS